MTHFVRFLFLTAAIAGGASNGYHVANKIKVGGEGGWDYLTVDSAAQRLYVSHATHVAVIDLDAGKVAGDIPDTPGVHGIAVAPELGRGFTSNGRSEIDTRTLAVTKHYSLAPCDAPSGLAMDVAHRRLFSVCENKMMVVSDPDTGKVVANVPIGPGSDGAAFDAERGLAFSSNGGDGTMTVVRQAAGKYEVQANVPTQRGARTIAIDPTTHKLYLSAAEYGAAAAGGRAPGLPNSFMVLVVEQ